MIDAPSPREELWNALTHGAGALLSCIGAAVLITLTALRGTGLQLAGAIVFGVALVGLYTASTLYHAARDPQTKARLKVLDHCAIYVLIAGSYTPFTLIGLRGHGGEAMFAAVWTLAALGVGFKLFFTGRFKGLSTAIYLGMGWLIVLAGKPLFVALSGPTLFWLFAGGAAYSLGTVFYMIRREWAHPVWHGFVLAGSACHFVAVSMQVLVKMQ
jgi:hemolysin III